MNYTVIVPFYNEEKNISSFNNELINNLKKINNSKRKLEIIYVDDGSNDETFNELKKLSTNSFETLIIKHRTNLSQSAAINTGIDQSKYENIIIMDGDLQNDPNDLNKMITEFEKGTDMLIGWRKHRKDNFFSYRHKTFFGVCKNSSKFCHLFLALIKIFVFEFKSLLIFFNVKVCILNVLKMTSNTNLGPIVRVC